MAGVQRDCSPTKRSRVTTGRTNRAALPRSQTPGVASVRSPSGPLSPIRQRSQTPGNISSRSTKLSQRSGGLLTGRSTPRVRGDIEIVEHSAAQGAQRVHSEDHRGHQHETKNKKFKERYGEKQAGTVEDSHMFKYQADQVEDFVQMDQGNFTDITTVNPDDVFGEAKVMPHEPGEQTDRSTGSLGSVVGRDAQAEKLRIRYVEQGLRAKLLSMVPGKNELQKAFKYFDVDDSGCIDAAEFRKVFKQLNIPLDASEARLLFDKYDTNGNGQVEYYEFITKFLPPDTNYNWRDYSAMGRVGFARVHPDLRVHKMCDILQNQVGNEKLGRLFDKVASSTTGPECFRHGERTITHLQFIQGMEKLGFQLSSKHWMHLLQVVDDDKSGLIDRKEFIEQFGTDAGVKSVLEGPGEATSTCYNPFYKWRDELNAADPVTMRTQLNVPTVTLPKPEVEGPKNPLDEDLTTCCDALKGLKSHFRAQRVSLAKFFQQFDENNNGWISRKELDVGLRKIGLELSKNEVKHLVRCMGVKEYEEGISRKAFSEMLCDDTVDTLEGIRGDVNDGRSKLKLGQTVVLPKGIQPNDGDMVRTPRGSIDYAKIDPDHRVSSAREDIVRRGAMTNTLHPERRTLDPPLRMQKGHTQSEAIRSSLETIQGWVEERGMSGAFTKLDKNQNQYVTADDLESVVPGLEADDAHALLDFLDHNRDGAVSLADFSATIREIHRTEPRLPRGQFTRLPYQVTPEMGYNSIPSTTRYCHTHQDDWTLRVPSRYGAGKRRLHENADGIVGKSVTGVAGSIIPRCDSPAYMSPGERFVRKTPEWEHANGRIEGLTTLGRVQGWQQDMIVADKARSRNLSLARQTRLNVFQGKARKDFERHSGRQDERASKTAELKKMQIGRYMRTVCAPLFGD